MYRSACNEHNRLLNRAELAAHGIQIDLGKMLEKYQLKRRRNEVNRVIDRVTERATQQGSRFSSRATLARALPDQQNN